jgi:hypothetical protein
VATLRTRAWEQSEYAPWVGSLLLPRSPINNHNKKGTQLRATQENKFEVIATAAFWQSKQLWAAQVQLRGYGSPTKIAGSALRDWPLRRDGLLATAIISALGNVSHKQRELLTQHGAMDKPRLLLRVYEPFVKSLKTRDLQIGNRMQRTLDRALERYEVTFETIAHEAVDPTSLALTLFAERSLKTQYQGGQDHLPIVYRPAVISVVDHDVPQSLTPLTPLTPDLIAVEESA